MLEFFRGLEEEGLIAIKHLTIAEEQHKVNENKHFHVLISLSKKLNTKNIRLFDYPDDFPRITPSCHPNIKKPSKTNAKSWCTDKFWYTIKD